MLRSTSGLSLNFNFDFLINQGARLESRTKIRTCGCNVGPLKLPAPVDFLKVNLAETICHCDDKSANSCKNYAQHRCRRQTSCEYIGCFGDSLRTGGLGMCCKCWTEAGRGGGGASSDHQLFSTTRQGQSLGVSRPGWKNILPRGQHQSGWNLTPSTERCIDCCREHLVRATCYLILWD